MQNKKTKIVATIGPVSTSEKQLEKLFKAGVNMIRLNFSHGDFAEHQEKVDNAKKVSEKMGIPISVMQDLAGPEIRTGKNLNDEPVKIKEGSTIIVSTKSQPVTSEVIHMDYKKITQEVSKGGLILVDDGKIQLKVLSIDEKKGEIKCKVTAGGIISKSTRGVNLPGAALSLKSLTKKDKDDLQFGKKNNVDYVAFSFVRTGKDVKELRKLLDGHGMQETGIIPKIETGQAVENIDEIIALSDAVMVARGDLAPEMTLEDVPLVQKMIIEKCNAAGKPVITATQMIETMVENPVPTRAEVSDIANAVLDGTDAIMLSAETALGKYSVEAVQVMSRVVKKIEESDRYLHTNTDQWLYMDEVPEVHDAITAEAVDTAESLDAKAIIAMTSTGRTARMVSRFKPLQPILAFTPSEKAYKKMTLSAGVTPIKTDGFTTYADGLKVVKEYCRKNKIAKKGDNIVVVASLPFGKAYDTNMILVETL